MSTFQEAKDSVIDGMYLTPFPETHIINTTYMGKAHSFEFIGFLEFKDDNVRRPVTSYTLGRMMGLGCLTEGQSVEFLREYFKKRHNDKITLAPHSVPIAIGEANEYPDILNKIKGIQMITKSIILRHDDKTQLGFDPLITHGKYSYLLGKDDEIKAEIIDEDGATRHLDRNFWLIPEHKGHKGYYTMKPVNFYATENGQKPKESLVSVAIEDDSVHVFSNTSLSHRNPQARFPIVKSRLQIS